MKTVSRAYGFRTLAWAGSLWLSLAATARAQTPAADSTAKGAADTAAAQPLVNEADACTMINQAMAERDSVQTALIASGKVTEKADTVKKDAMNMSISTSYSYADQASQAAFQAASLKENAAADTALTNRKQLRCRGSDRAYYTIKRQNGGYVIQRLGMPPKPRKQPKP